jgi:hypothetical protein
MKRLRWGAASALAFGLCLLAFWGGEGGGSLTGYKDLDLITAAAWAAGAAAAAPVLFARKLMGAVILLALSCALYAAGFASLQYALKECRHGGFDEVSALITRYEIEKGHLPDRLKDVGGRLPCSRFLRGNLISYEKGRGEFALTTTSN